jgi:hypothetical protein
VLHGTVKRERYIKAGIRDDVLLFITGSISRSRKACIEDIIIHLPLAICLFSPYFNILAIVFFSGGKKYKVV